MLINFVSRKKHSKELVLSGLLQNKMQHQVEQTCPGVPEPVFDGPTPSASAGSHGPAEQAGTFSESASDKNTQLALPESSAGRPAETKIRML